MAKKKSEDRHTGTMVGVRLDAEMMAALQAIAAREDRTLAMIVKRSLALYAVRYGHAWPVPAPDLEPIPISLSAPPKPADGSVS